LNVLNERAKTNSRARSVPVTDLVRRHTPHTPSQLRKLIETHYRTQCDCGIRSKGPVERFALNLYEAQFTDAAYTAEHAPVPYDQCFRFMHALFCVAPLRGVNMEVASRDALLAALGEASERPASWTAREATQHEDADCAVDFVLLRDGEVVAGVQVKPDSVLARADVMALNRRKQRAFDHPVFFHVYSTERLAFCERETQKLAATILERIDRRGDDDDAPCPLTESPAKRAKTDPAGDRPAFW
jgi:hypothetical protein